MSNRLQPPSVATIQTLVTTGLSALEQQSDSPKLDSQLLLAFVLGKPTTYLLTWPEQQVEQGLIHQFYQLLERRISGEPIAYIIGYKEFWSLPIKVSPATLIPRPDTETLIEQVITQYSTDADSNLHCLDLGTGTGAIALALASEFPQWHFDAVDYSNDAVSLAQQNVDELGFNNITVYQSNWFSEIAQHKKFNLIVSNPPYIDGSDHHLVEGDVRFEPKSALVAANNGYLDIEVIADNARAYLTDGGSIFIEHGYQQAQTVQAILSRFGYLQIKTIQDLAGNDRITTAQWSTDD